jgi:cbb3-type cytochrome oxidase maturation protein
MSVLVLLIVASLAMAGFFLAAFIWAVRTGQYEDTCTPSMRPLFEEPVLGTGAGVDAQPELEHSSQPKNK